MVWSVQFRAEGTLGQLLGSASSDLDVEALRVVLRAVLGARAVHGNDLVAEDVVAGCQARRDRGGPGVVVGNEVCRGPDLG